VHLQDLPSSAVGEAGKVWVIVRRMPGIFTVSLVNLVRAQDTNWDTPKPPPLTLHNLEMEVRVEGEVQGVFTASPDSDDERPHQLVHHTIQRDGSEWMSLNLPRLEFWSMIVIKMSPGDSVQKG
jgi:hypothetical protein